LAEVAFGLLAQGWTIIDESRQLSSRTKSWGGGLFLVVFLVLFFLCVIGIEQLREAHRDRPIGSFLWTPTAAGSLSKFYLPCWGRMAVWFIATCIAAIVVRILFPAS